MLLFIFTSLLINLNFVSPATASGWETDYAYALAKAESEDKFVFMLFTGSDWCMSCKRLSKKILSSEAFSEFASENLILLEVDFPRDDRNQDVKLKNQNELLAKKYNREGAVPKIVLLKDGQSIGQTIYRGESAGGFIKKLNGLIEAN